MNLEENPFLHLSQRQVDEVIEKIGEISFVPGVSIHAAGMANTSPAVFEEWTHRMVIEGIVQQMIATYIGEEEAEIVTLNDATGTTRGFLVMRDDRERIISEVMNNG